MCRRPAVSTSRIVGGSRLRGGGGVKERGRRIASLLGLDDGDAGPRSPDLKLLDGRGAEGVGGAQQHGLALAAVERGQLAAGGRLARAVDADQQDDLRRSRRVADGRVHRVEDAANLVLQGSLQLGAVRQAVSKRAVAQARDDLISRRRSDVGGEQSELQLVERALVDLARERDDAGDGVRERLPRARNRLAHAVEEAAAFGLLGLALRTLGFRLAVLVFRFACRACRRVR